MKKNHLKKAIGLGMVFALTLGLTACGGKGNSTANAALAKENVYKMQEISVPEFVDGDNGYSNICGSAYRDGRVYMLVQVETYNESGNNETTLNLFSMKSDGSDSQTVPLEMPAKVERTGEGIGDGEGAGDGAEGEEEAGGGEGAGIEARTGDEEGAGDGAEGEEDTGDEAEGEEGDGAADVASTSSMQSDTAMMVAAGELNSWEYNNYSNFVISSQGVIYGTQNYSYEEFNGEEHYSENHFFVCGWDMNGALLWRTEYEDMSRRDQGDGEWIYINTVAEAKDGSYNMLVLGDNAYKVAVSADGVISEKEKLSEDSYGILNYAQNTIDRGDGTFLVMYSDENDWTKQFVTVYDIESDTFEEPVPMLGSLSWQGYNTISAGLSNDLIYSNQSGVYVYNRGDAEATKRMDYINSDLNISSFSSFVELDENSFIGTFYEDYTGDMKAGLFTYVKPEDIPDKAVIVLAGNYVNSSIKQRVVEYNRASDTYRIVVKEYNGYNSYDDYQAGYTKLNNDIITGGMPDILLTEGLPMENYIAKGLIADVNKLIEKDEELSQVEFLQNVFDAFSVDGKLYYVVPSFTVNTMVAKESLVGDRENWTMDEMQQVLADMGENTQAIGETTRSDFMSMAMQFCGSDFIDISTGKCDFDSENFIAMMEFAKTLPEEINWEETYTDEYWSSYESQYRDNKTLLMNMYIGSFNNLVYTMNGYFGEPISFVGFPTENGTGSVISTYTAYALSSRSANLEGAWDFVRYYLTDEHQKQIMEEGSLPVNSRFFEEASTAATRRPYYTDENGEKIEYDEEFYINGESIKLPPLTQEQVDQVKDFIRSVDQVYYYNENVLNIINEEMDAFYTGQKSAKDVAAIIQSRAQVYVDENR